MIFDQEFFERFGEKLDQFHSMFKHNKLKAELLEELIYESLSGENIEWECGSHKQEYDIQVDGVSIQVKSGQTTHKGRYLKLSSHRTTKYGTIQGKVEHMKRVSSDLIFSCTNNKNGYVCYVFDGSKISSILDADKFDEVKGGWKFTFGGVECKITKSLSDQAWYKIDLEELGIEPVWSYEIK